MEKKSGVFAGTFDPVHFGHLHIIEKSLKFLDHVFVVVANNSNKKTLLSLDARMELLSKSCESIQESATRITFQVLNYGLVVQHAKQIGASVLIRGVRNTMDCAYELDIASVNNTQAGDLPTIFIPTAPELSYVSSSAVRELIACKGDLTEYLPSFMLPVIQNLVI